ncbi:RHS repeat-associated core domain-containing protein [Streptomyces massasporeus]
MAAGGYDLTYDKAGRITSGCAPQPQVSGCAASRTTTYTYDKTGNRLTSTLGNTTTGYLDLRARQYDTTTGRFTRPDPFTPDPDTPYTQAYAYVENMPTSRVDPSGMCSVTTQMKDLFSGNWGWNSECDRSAGSSAASAQAGCPLSKRLRGRSVDSDREAEAQVLDVLAALGRCGLVAMVKIDGERQEPDARRWTFVVTGGALAAAPVRVDAASPADCLEDALRILRGRGIELS